jgi:hypothetical protein
MKPVPLLKMRCLTAVLIAVLGAWSLSAWAYQVNTFPADAPIVEQGTVDRESAQKGKGGFFQPPWTSVKVFVGLARAISVGDSVTVLPMKQGLPPLQAKATSVQFQQGVPDELPDLWLVDIDVDAPAFFSARPDRHRRDDMPFDALVVYPAQTQARLLAAAAVAKDLPRERGCSKRTLRAAVDLDADGKADVTMFEFCCQKSTSPRTTSPCENTCQATNLRRNGQPWRLVEEAYDD